MPSPTPLVLYVYRCAACGHAGELRLAESALEVTTACTTCGAEVVAGIHFLVSGSIRD